MPRFLVIGYGNTLRRDDGVGVKVAEAIAAMELPGVEVITRHQLVPELAAAVSEVDAVVFVDADAVTTGTVELRPIEADEGVGRILAHATDPRSLLALAKKIFGGAPKAWALAIPVNDFGFGDGLSPRALEGFHAAVKQISDLFQNKFCEAVANAG